MHARGDTKSSKYSLHNRFFFCCAAACPFLVVVRIAFVVDTSAHDNQDLFQSIVSCCFCFCRQEITPATQSCSPLAVFSVALSVFSWALLRSNYLRSGLGAAYEKVARSVLAYRRRRRRSVTISREVGARRPAYSFSTLPNCPPPGFRRASSARSAALKSNVHACWSAYRWLLQNT